uniref:Hsp70 family protein n=1 Tax=Pseudothermotoga hypogea TaxID=57487 RepID=A0A832I926_9THEM
MAVIGIDLGTSTSEVAYYRNGVTYVICMVPSYVGINADGEFVFGEDAKGQYIGRPHHTVTEFKRLMGTNEKIRLGDKVFKPEEVSALLLGYLKKIAEEYLQENGNEPLEEAVITVPANFDDNQRRATMLAAQLAGIKCERIINEPTAAALAFGIKNIDKDMRVLVYDFGGGTLDVTVLKMFEGILDVETSYGDTKLGGKDFDERMMNLIIRKIREKYEITLDTKDLLVLSKLKDLAEKAKIELSFAPETTVIMENMPAGGKLQDLSVTVTRREFENAVKDLIERSGVIIDKALEDKGLTYKDIDFVLMIGGTSQIPLVRNYVRNKIGKEIRTEINPIEAVARGAAIQAAIKAGIISEENSVLITDVCPFNLGIEVAADINGVLVPGVFQKLIERNSTVPTTRSEVFTTAVDYQTEIQVKVYQTLENDCVWAKEATLIGEFLLENIPPKPKGQVPIKVEYSYDINGNIKVVAEVLTTGHRRELEIRRANQVGAVHHSKEVDEALKKLRGQSVLNNYKNMALYKKYKLTIEGVEKRLEKSQHTSEDHNLQKLRTLLDELKNCIARNDEEKADKIEAQIIDLLFSMG